MREFRVAARKKETFQTRTVVAWWLLIAGGLFLRWNDADAAEQGPLLFVIFHAMTFGAIWLIVPFATADVISREKREGTLGLLLLTPLRNFEVAGAKCLSQLLQALVLLVAVLPLFALPALMGGVTAWDCLRAFCLNLSAVIGATAAGLLASSCCEKAGRAVLLVLPVSLLLWVFLYLLHAGLLVVHAMWSIGLLSDPEYGWNQVLYLLSESPGLPFMLATGAGELLWQQPEFRSSPGAVSIAAITSLQALALAGLVMVFAGRRIGRFQQGAFAPRLRRWRQFLVRERFFVSRLARATRRLLDRNPIAWLHERRWSARMVRWSWLLAVVVVLGWWGPETKNGYEFWVASLWLLGFMLVSLWFSSTAGLREERESGALELLLSTELSPATLVNARLVAMWRSCVPAMGMLLLLVLGSMPLIGDVFDDHSNLLAFAVSFVTVPLVVIVAAVALPMIGLFASLISRDGGTAAVVSFAFSVLMPWGVPLLIFLGGMFGYQLHHELTVGEEYMPWLMVSIGVTATAAGQLALVVARRRGVLPCLWPQWWSRTRLTLIVPWAGPVLMWLCLEAGLGAWLRYHQQAELVFVGLWQAIALVLLGHYGFYARRRLIELLENREFSPGAAR